MKRTISVLAAALILILINSDNAESRRYPEIRIDEVQWDHPWGGEEQNTNPPQNYSITTNIKNNLTFMGIVKSLNYRYFFNGSTFIMGGTRSIVTTDITNLTTTTTTTTNDVNQNTSQKGMGQ